MRVFHGSTVTVEHPDVLHSDRTLDFGRGFYVTQDREQAVRWAHRKADILNTDHMILNIYQVHIALEELKIKDFGDDLDEWIDFVCACRDGDMVYQDYDII